MNPPLTTPLRFEPYLRPLVWGGRRLESVLDKCLPTDEPYGESWEVSDHASHRTVVAEGIHAGKSVRDLMRDSRVDLLGTDRHDVFPWLVKFLDARDWLSVQVHPDDANAQTLWPGEGGKTEIWFILAADPGARIWAGLKPGVTRESFRAALEHGEILDCLHEIEPAPGQCLFLPAGTVHAVGGGVILAEVQQTSDATFRLFDWNRKDAQGQARALHIEQGLAAMHWPQGPVEPIVVPNFPSGGLKPTTQSLGRCPYFDVDYIQTMQPLSVGGVDALSLVIVLAGDARFDSGEEACAGQVWVMPAAMPGMRLHPGVGGVRVLSCVLPVGNVDGMAGRARNGEGGASCAS